MTTTGTEALEAILAHHRLLEERVGQCVATLQGAVDTGTSHEPAVAELVAYLADEVLPHALAEEHTIYRVASARAELSDIVAEMIAEHRSLASATERLADVRIADVAKAQAQEIAVLFATHVAKENDILLPVLVADEEVDLAQLLIQMHRLTEAARDEPLLTEDAAASDPEAVVLSLLLEAANDLSHAGHADRACRLTASAWAALRMPRPDLAVRVTAALHRLARTVTAEPITLGLSSNGQLSATDPVLDVRQLAPAQRHQSIFASYQTLDPGTAFVLVNDHDPKPLRYQFEAEHAGEFTWATLEVGPQVWRVRIGRRAAAPGTPHEATKPQHHDEPELDVRSLPHGNRPGSIFDAYQTLPPGAGFVLVNDHDPKPLRYQFEAEHAGEFTWDYLEAGPQIWRVRIGRARTAGS